MKNHLRHLPRILIVDDVLDNIEILAKALADDYEVSFATSGEETLVLARQNEAPDLILLDIMMPGMDGYEVCRRLKEDSGTRDIAVIFVTAKSSVEDQERGFDLGAVDYITKPFELPLVRARVRTHVRLKQRGDLLEELAFVDALTGIHNRRRFDEALPAEYGRAERNRTPLSLLMIDIDYFKLFNDHYGHGAGDECLIRVAGILSTALSRPTDLLARYGGEEFVVVLPDSEEAGAAEVAETLRRRVEEAAIPHADSPTADHVTVSVGIAALTGGERKVSASELLAAADRGLYLAKESGRNRVVAHRP